LFFKEVIGNCQYINVHTCIQSLLSIVINCLFYNNAIISLIREYIELREKKRREISIWIHFIINLITILLSHCSSRLASPLTICCISKAIISFIKRPSDELNCSLFAIHISIRYRRQVIRPWFPSRGTFS